MQIYLFLIKKKTKIKVFTSSNCHLPIIILSTTQISRTFNGFTDYFINSNIHLQSFSLPLMISNIFIKRHLTINLKTKLIFHVFLSFIKKKLIKHTFTIFDSKKTVKIAKKKKNKHK